MSGVLLGLVALRIGTSIPQIVDRWVKYGKNSSMRPQTVGKCRINVWEDSLKEHVLLLSQEAVDIVWHAVRCENAAVARIFDCCQRELHRLVEKTHSRVSNYSLCI
jgi:hypothetical protein